MLRYLRLVISENMRNCVWNRPLTYCDGNGTINDYIPKLACVLSVPLVLKAQLFHLVRELVSLSICFIPIVISNVVVKQPVLYILTK